MVVTRHPFLLVEEGPTSRRNNDGAVADATTTKEMEGPKKEPRAAVEEATRARLLQAPEQSSTNKKCC